VLATLAGQMEGQARQEALARGLEAALAIRDERDRARALATLAGRLEIAPDREQFLARLREGITRLLWDCRQVKREELLKVLAQKDLFCPPIASTATLAAIARHISEICWEWRWG